MDEISLFFVSVVLENIKVLIGNLFFEIKFVCFIGGCGSGGGCGCLV